MNNFILKLMMFALVMINRIRAALSKKILDILAVDDAGILQFTPKELADSLRK